MDQRIALLQSAPAACTESRASTWHGLMDSGAPQQALAHWDKLLNAALGASTAHILPAAIGLAMTDWLLHLALPTSRRELLVAKAWKKYWRWQPLAQQAGGAACRIEPLPQDKRIADPAWQRWPYTIVYQAFLLQQQWWHVASTGLPGAYVWQSERVAMIDHNAHLQYGRLMPVKQILAGS
jgi:polyhydroxyalkanoate synthase subunit PhaC